MVTVDKGGLNFPKGEEASLSEDPPSLLPVGRQPLFLPVLSLLTRQHVFVEDGTKTFHARVIVWFQLQEQSLLQQSR